MLKRILLIAAVCTAMLTGSQIVSAQPAIDATATEAADSLSSQNGQTTVEGDWVNSEEVNTVQEGEIARKMTQAEKAKNAAENDSWGGAITIIAMCIVLAALIILSLLFLGFGKISSTLLSRKKLEAHGLTKDDVDEDHEDVDSGETIAAIALALSEHFNARHDIEDTILTIRKLRKAYSPWNSKIYNMREVPELKRNKLK